ncbi:MOS1T-like protein [Mya arenaria]|uniref:MOS1T-like protein n=1 Tax=Mya arenaria TaxID=6604 RepID=A0ABY7DYP9_MYAAR|nr:MOS1T-like protein [Mya arenaria]
MTTCVVRRDMVQALHKKRPGMEEDIENVLFHQDNAPAHRARYTELELDVLGIGRLKHAPYSLDLAPLDFALFPAVKAHLRGIRFDDLESLRRHIKDSRDFNNVDLKGVHVCKMKPNGEKVGVESNSSETTAEKNACLKEAFSITDYYQDDSSFDPNIKTKEDAAKALAMAQKKYA